MSDLFDRFIGSAGALSGHTADSGDTWPTGTGNASISGAGALFGTDSTSEDDHTQPLSSWTPPGTDYAVKAVIGADYISGPVSGETMGVTARGSGTAGSESYYGGILASTTQFLFYRVTGSGGTVLGGVQSLGRTLAAGDTIELQVSGTGATVTLVFLVNGSVIATYLDTDSTRIVAAGTVGLYLNTSNQTAHPDQIRTLWAGAIGGPSEGISPSSASVGHTATQALAATGGLPNETLNWTATHGSFTGSPGTSVTYTAPASGSSDAAMWTSVDLPTHTATAAITLTEPGSLVLTGPTTGTTGSASTNFTVTVASLSGNDTITPTSNNGGSFSPSSLSATTITTTASFTFTPSSDGTHAISITDSIGAAISGSPITYTSTTTGTGKRSRKGPSARRRAVPPLDFPVRPK